MAGQYSQPPVRQPSGATTDPVWGPLADDGYGNPFFYHAVQDDFDATLTTSIWAQTNTGNGSVAHTPGDGGLALFTTNSTTPLATDISAIQLPAASFTLTLGKKLFFLARLQVADATNAAINIGLIQKTSTPFTVTDGIWFSKASGSTLVNLNSASASVVTTVSTVFNMANATNVDMAFYLTRQGDILAFIASQLVGYIPSSGTGTLTPPQPGPNIRSTAPTLTTAVLTPTMALQSGTASSKTMTADFVMAHKER